MKVINFRAIIYFILISFFFLKKTVLFFCKGKNTPSRKWKNCWNSRSKRQGHTPSLASPPFPESSSQHGPFLLLDLFSVIFLLSFNTEICWQSRTQWFIKRAFQTSHWDLNFFMCVLYVPVAKSCLTLCDPTGCHFLLQGIFPTQGLNPHL